MNTFKTYAGWALLFPLALLQVQGAPGTTPAMFSNDPVIAFGNTAGTTFTWTPVKGYSDTISADADYVYLPTIGGYSRAEAISANGQVIIGTSGSEANLAVFWNAGVITDLSGSFGESVPTYSYTVAVNHDGSVIAGNVNVHPSLTPTAFRWTIAGSVFLQAPESSDNTYFTGATLMTPSGNAIAGYWVDDNYYSHAALWKNSLVAIDIHPNVESEGSSNPIAINTDGTVVAVQLQTIYQSEENRGGLYAYRWSEGTGSVALGHLGAGTQSMVLAMDASGSVLVGAATTDSEDSNGHAFRWTQSGGMQDLHSNTWTQTNSSAQFISRDGSVIVGGAYGNDSVRAFRWTTANGAVLLPTFGGNTYAAAMTPDGRVVVGNSEDGESVSHGFRWTENGGIQTVEQWLAASGVTLSDSIHIVGAESISDDGSVVTGYLDSNDIFIAKGDAGLMTLADAQQSIAQTQAAVASIRTSANLVLNGAHGHPLSRRAEDGRFITWAGGDYGQDDHGSRDGSVAVAEVGGGYNFGPTQLNLAVGRSDSRQDTEFSGDVKHTGTFLIADFITPIPNSPLVFTLTGIYQWSSLDTNRGYLNGGLPDMSSGDTDAQTYGGAARLDWVDAVKFKKFSVSPFGKVVLTESTIDAFTETGGGFPASYGEQTDTITDLHLGANLTYTLRKNLRLVGTLEAIHRVQDGASAGSVSIPGVTIGFAGIAGEDYKQDWGSGGIGADYDIGAGTISFMLNASTDGPAPSAWVATSYLYKF